MNYIMLALTVFSIFVAPLWLILHYRSKKQTSKDFSTEDQQQLQALLNRSEELQKRITSLEKILDAKAPHWRDHEQF